MRTGSLTNGQGGGEAVTRLLLPAGRIGGVIGRGGEVGFISGVCRTFFCLCSCLSRRSFPCLFTIGFALSDVLMSETQGRVLLALCRSLEWAATSIWILDAQICVSSTG